MGLLVNGEWVDKWYDTEKSDGKFVRQDSRFRDTISSAPQSKFTPEAGRYHLYVSLACPWAHRTIIFRKLKQLEDIISMSIVEAPMMENGWEFGEQGDPLYNLDYAYQLYLKADPSYEGRVTVPILWDKKTQTIVNNESIEIIRMLNSAFNELTGNTDDYYPEPLREEIEAVNNRVYNTINNGVYKAGFATTQEAYNEAYTALFDSLDWLEARLAKQRYLVGDVITEADWRLFTTLIRFDAVYHGHFKCNRQKLSEFHHISNYVNELYQVPGVKETVDLEYTKVHYYVSHLTINPTQIVPLGAKHHFDAPHDRERSY
ncbi:MULTISPECIES: glutathione S-transferase family protein [Pseudoalteromonas]|uniref:glutathione S-transferase family protein n=1 Tax=Pseudoalteromonas TaxID=53246 RepID=UPI00055DD9D4|nr:MULTISPECIES: glutathione S-transferase family protein [Pseudoalteromonas]MAY59907.1 glutathione S-transferase family protein [Pseudoalteromonas sp.]MDN3393699.1 glutathione S-transferase family protein [Pseudoalteromonas sp. APC 3215]MDN3403552.1 glutathione S-transferase family protein [Pseudoalteromonas sp. APC 3218]MDN3407391.1 glutathione S-transferase family protein [Pseudoalteromonas sp. APC 3894]MDN3414702.1 glutathione S-transferase family protein [Pseudoalteromonas sp. APC 3227]|tara:strand:+ start:40017 stop:40967 length:951 start_codon:yes stop_codon:yes gene_type:complete